MAASRAFAAKGASILGVLCLALAGAAVGQTLHYDAAGEAGAPALDPTSTGWTFVDPSAGVVRVGPSAPDPSSGEQAWQIADPSTAANSRAHYAALLSASDALTAAHRGWRLEARLRVASGAGPDAFVELATGRDARDDRYVVFVTVDGADVVVRDAGAGVDHRVVGAADGRLHDLALEKQRGLAATDAALTFDGAPIGVVRRAGSNANGAAGGVHFGAGSSGGTVVAHFRRIALTLGPPVDLDAVDVFVGGEGYPAYRIPSLLVTRTGAVLAFAEGRAALSDHARNDIVLRRSTDGGATFGALQVIADEGLDALNNPCAVELREGPRAGRILLQYQRYPSGCHESCVQPGWTGPNICRSYIVHSDDDGVTWSAPREVTTEVKAPTVMDSIASGPGVGLQKRRAPHAGRVVFPFNHGEPGSVWRVYAVFSDDGGDTWTRGQVADDSEAPGHGNEVQMVELVDGALLLNARSMGGAHRRKVARSFDGGATWTPLADSPLVEPECMAALVRFSDPLDLEPSRVVYTGPDSPSGRERGTVRISADEGVTWPVARLLVPGSFAYSAAARLADGRLGVLVERDGYARITLLRAGLAWLTEGSDPALGPASDRR